MNLNAFMAQGMLLPHDAIPHGVPSSYDWYRNGVVQNPLPHIFDTHFFNPWGQVYIPADGSYNMKGAKAEVRELRSYLLLRSTGEWQPAYETLPGLTGCLYPEDFRTDLHPQQGVILDRVRPGSIMHYPEERDGIGYAFHFYPDVARLPINNRDVCGVAVSCRARLALVNDDLGDPPRLLASVGADYWKLPSGGPVRGVGQGRLKWLDENWRLLTFTTAPFVPLVLEDQSELR